VVVCVTVEVAGGVRQQAFCRPILLTRHTVLSDVKGAPVLAEGSCMSPQDYVQLLSRAVFKNWQQPTRRERNDVISFVQASWL